MAISSNSSQTTHPSKPGDQNDKPRGCLGALVAVGVFIPIPLLAASLTLLGYFLLPSLSAPTYIITILPLLGLIITIIVWLLLARLCMPLATARGGKLSDYEIFQGDLNVLKAQFEVVKSKTPEDAATSAPLMEPEEAAKHNQATEPGKARETVIAYIQSNLDEIDDMIQRKGMTWVLRTGYISLWDRINKADEAMIDILSTQQVIEAANYDMLRLNGSDVPGHEDLLKRLATAITILRSELHCSEQSSEQHQDTNVQQSIVQAKCAIEPPDSSTTTKSDQQEARSNIRQVKSALHKFTNERWDLLVRARNQLMGIAFLTSVLTYIIVVVAMLVGIQKINMVHLIAFYLLGAVVGLFSRLVGELQTKDTDISHKDDYGLTGARIVVTPWLSGLAALIGVLLATMLSIVLTTTLSHGPTDQSFPPLGTIYDYSKYPQNLVLAAIFGFLPSLAVGLLKQQANKIQSQINSSTPGQMSSSSSADQGKK